MSDTVIFLIYLFGHPSILQTEKNSITYIDLAAVNEELKTRHVNDLPYYPQSQVICIKKIDKTRMNFIYFTTINEQYLQSIIMKYSADKTCKYLLALAIYYNCVNSVLIMSPLSKERHIVFYLVF